MIIADTSVWIDHLRKGNARLEDQLNKGRVACHPLIVGELACGQMKNRKEILSLLQDLPSCARADDEDVLPFIETHKLMGKGLGYIDVHLLMSARLMSYRLWTFDKKLHDAARKILPAN